MDPEPQVFQSMFCVLPAKFLASMRAVDSHTGKLELFLLFVEPGGRFGVLRKEEEDYDAADDGWDTFEDEEPPPAFETTSSVHVTNAKSKCSVCVSSLQTSLYSEDDNSPAKGSCQGGAAQKSSNSSSSFFWLVPEAEVEYHTREDTCFCCA
jgi:hypothetical protein